MKIRTVDIFLEIARKILCPGKLSTISTISTISSGSEESNGFWQIDYFLFGNLMLYFCYCVSSRRL